MLDDRAESFGCHFKFYLIACWFVLFVWGIGLGDGGWRRTWRWSGLIIVGQTFRPRLGLSFVYIPPFWELVQKRNFRLHRHLGIRVQSFVEFRLICESFLVIYIFGKAVQKHQPSTVSFEF